MDKSNVTQLHPKGDQQKEEASLLSSLSPREIVSELDRFVVGQNKAKRAVAVALRNRWRRQALKGEMRNEVLPKNILMIGPTGVGKTEISRRLSKLAEAPFVKVEATRFTEVGYVGRDVVAGFAGSTADALTLFERLEGKLEKHAGNLSRAAVELAKDWRTDKYLRRLEALMAVGDKNNSYIISGTGDVLEPEGDVIGIGSGGNYALAAGKVLIKGDMSAEEVAKKAIKVAADICVFTNENVKVEKI